MNKVNDKLHPSLQIEGQTATRLGVNTNLRAGFVPPPPQSPPPGALPPATPSEIQEKVDEIDARAAQSASEALGLPGVSTELEYMTHGMTIPGRP
ncbi:MAG: hypothetical protein AAF438_21345 [Pseudomonadota bacterium]